MCTTTVPYSGTSIIKTAISKYCGKALQLNKRPGATHGSTQPQAKIMFLGYRTPVRKLRYVR